MERVTWIVGLCASFAALSVAVPSQIAQAQSQYQGQDLELSTDWRKWGGPRGDFILDSSVELADSWPPDGPPLLWSRALGAGHSAILVGDGRLYTSYRVAYGPGGGQPVCQRGDGHLDGRGHRRNGVGVHL